MGFMNAALGLRLAPDFFLGAAFLADFFGAFFAADFFAAGFLAGFFFVAIMVMPPVKNMTPEYSFISPSKAIDESIDRMPTCNKFVNEKTVVFRGKMQLRAEEKSRR
jgi:hypothetical protein